MISTIRPPAIMETHLTVLFMIYLLSQEDHSLRRDKQIIQGSVFGTRRYHMDNLLRERYFYPIFIEGFFYSSIQIKFN